MNQTALKIIDTSLKEEKSMYATFLEQLAINQVHLNEGDLAFLIITLFDTLIRSDKSQTQERL